MPDVTAQSSTPSPYEEEKKTSLTDASEHPNVTEAKRRLNTILTENLPAEVIAEHIRFMIRAADHTPAGFKINVKGVRAIVERLRMLGYDGEDRFNEFQDSGHAKPYSPEDALNSFRAHCEKLLASSYSGVSDSTVFDLTRSDIVLEHSA